MIAGLYVGSFDPITNGHLDMIRRSMAFCQKLYVVVGVNPKKQTMFTSSERVSLIEKVIAAELPGTNIKILSHKGLIATLAQGLKVNVFIRGVRSVADFEYELNWTLINKEIVSTIETVFIPANPMFSTVSSSAVKELASFNVPMGKFVHPIVASALAEKLKNQSL